jgi:hypothetical protein
VTATAKERKKERFHSGIFALSALLSIHFLFFLHVFRFDTLTTEKIFSSEFIKSTTQESCRGLFIRKFYSFAGEHSLWLRLRRAVFLRG